MRKIGLFLVVGLALAWTVLSGNMASAATGEANYALKAAVESRIEERLKAALREIAGTENILAIVNAMVKEDVGGYSGVSDNSRALVLPGVPVQKEIGKSERNSQPAPLPPARIERLNVVVLVDTSVGADLLPVLKDVAASAMGLNADRGDKLEVRQVTFQGQGFKWARYFFPPHIYYIILIVLGSFFVLAAAHFMNDPFGNLATALRNVDWDAVRGRSAQAAAATTAAAEAELSPMKFDEPEATMADSTGPVPFSFVKERHLSEISYLLAKASDTEIAVVVNYLQPELASKLIEMFPAERQIAVATILSEGIDMSPDRVAEIENTVRKKVDYVIGGDRKLVPILDMLKPEVREAVLGRVQGKDVEAAERLKRRLRSFETLVMELSHLSIQALYRQLNPTMVARILKASSQEVRERFFASLSEGAVQRLREEMELSHPLAENRLRREKNNVLTVARRMAAAGLIEEVED